MAAKNWIARCYKPGNCGPDDVELRIDGMSKSAATKEARRVAKLRGWRFLELDERTESVANVLQQPICDIAKAIGTEAQDELIHAMTEKQQAVHDLAATIGAEVYKGYSGRGMYGKECLGISCDDDADVLMRCRGFGLPKPSIDNLGRGYICYWPSIPSVTSEGEGE